MDTAACRQWALDELSALATTIESDYNGESIPAERIAEIIRDWMEDMRREA
jgi:hypothetical protein